MLASSVRRGILDLVRAPLRKGARPFAACPVGSRAGRRERRDGWLAHGVLPFGVVSLENPIVLSRHGRKGSGLLVLLLDDRIARVFAAGGRGMIPE